jgi:outer membrane protein insertion porin family
VGIGASWLSPIGALSVSLGFPLNAKDDDQVENFQFNLGQTF